MSKSGYAPGSIVELSSEELKEWRRTLPKGSVRTVDTGVRNLTPVDRSDGDNAVIRREAETRRSFVEPTEVMAKVIGPMLEDLMRTKAKSESAFLDRVRNLKVLAGWEHMTDEECATQLEGLATKIAAIVAEERYKALGKLRPVNMDGTGIGHQTGPILLPGQVGRNGDNR